MKKSSFRAQKRNKTVWRKMISKCTSLTENVHLLCSYNTDAAPYSCLNPRSCGSGLALPSSMLRTCEYSDSPDPS